MILEQILNDCHMRACAAATELYLVKKEMSTPEILAEKFKVQRMPGEEVRVGGGPNSWIRKDGEENPDYPEYIWVVGKRIV